ncbi:hypothetical protein [Sinorhizobium numidicum]|uniref:hypothetical protein n=1 Tax=Sinorhizobium numidicum TaxID=680248 RepID=UPI003CC85BB4
MYAQAAREGAPQALQVADRFHLMQNLRVAIEEQMSLSGRATGRALLPDKRIGSAQIDLSRDPHVDARHRRRRHAHRQSRQVVFDTVHALNEEGLSYSEIARRTGYGRRSIAKWLTFEAPPDRQKAALKRHRPCTSRRFSPRAGKMASAADGICSTISNSAATRAVSRISSGFSQAGAVRRDRPRTALRRLRLSRINQAALLSRYAIGRPVM